MVDASPRTPVSENLSSGVPSCDPLLLKIVSERAVSLGRRPDEILGVDVDWAMLNHRRWRAHVVEAFGDRGEAVVRKAQRLQMRERIKKKGLLEFIRGAWGQGVDNLLGASCDGLPVLPGGWGVLEPVTKLIEGKHIEVICRVLEAVTFKKGEIWNMIAAHTGGVADVIINVPPGMMKSLLVNVFWPAWEWGEVSSGASRWLFWTYAKDLSLRDSQKMRELVESEWYQWLYPDVRLSARQNEKDRYNTTRHGYRIATSVEGGGTGEAANYVGWDDPHKARDAMYSDAVRESTLNAWKSTMTNRQRPVNSGARVGIMQRLHPMDMTGYLDETGCWYPVVLPMRFDPLHPRLSVFDWRKKKGELLWPEGQPLLKVKQIEREMGSPEIIAGQHEQLPMISGGNIFKREWFKPWFIDFPRFEFVVQSYDTAFTEKTVNDPSAMLAGGVFTDDLRKGAHSVLLMEGWQKRLSYPDLRVEVKNAFLKKEYGLGEGARSLLGDPVIKPMDWEARNGLTASPRGRAPDIALIEEKGSGLALKLDLERAGVPVVGYNPGNMDKIARAHAVAHLVKQGCVYLPAIETGRGSFQFVDWAERFVKEMIGFPRFPTDDWVDCCTQLLAVLRDMSMLRPVEDERDEKPDEGLVIDHEPRRNPYLA